ncbi:MAG: alpha-amylase family glycosyl hydrolase [Bacteroides sp.]|nr:alpha-amylase family glycosyl hydrolase [Eubacterium sp.]MCM1418482.1 alpha-amylase family glycosyl hydrolase [Roseburia sp.]MCM1462501.1 alpha-amylase family glycosyl hydrolase [Bacteroides sp.]
MNTNESPAWLDNAIFYEIYPQSFCDSNGDGIGDFNGIISKLDYIKELGCNAIWLNPCFQSPFGDAGYDVSDYYAVAPRYGTNEELKRLFEEVHKREMHILLDLVPGHTSVEHEWFRQSMKAERNAFTDRYVWTDSIWEEPEGMGCIRGISDRDGSCAVNFFSHQPALNYGFYKPDPEKKWQQSTDSEGARATLEALKDIMRFWLKMGCDGFRVDMAGSLVKHDEDGKGTIKLWQNVREFLDREFPEAAMVSEWGEPDKSLKGGFHMDFLLHFGPSHYNDLFRCAEPFFSDRGRGDISEFVKKYKENYEKSERRGLICIPSGNHDMDRLSRSVRGENLKIAFAFLLSMPGAPFIYYGDEIGLRYVEGLTSVEGGYGRTGSRSPMQWDDGVNAGFSAAPAEKLYIPIDPDPDRPTVKAQIADENSLYNEIKRLIAIRQAHPALQSRGEIEFVYAERNAYPLAYVRSAGNEKILVIINPADRETAFPCGYAPRKGLYSFGGEVAVSGGRIAVPPRFAGFYEV